jgi:hypothetical protein
VLHAGPVTEVAGRGIQPGPASGGNASARNTTWCRKGRSRARTAGFVAGPGRFHLLAGGIIHCQVRSTRPVSPENLVHTLGTGRRLAGLELSPVPTRFPPQDRYVPPSRPEGPQHQQLHLDVAVEELDSATEAAVALGATPAKHQPAPEQWRVLLDRRRTPFLPHRRPPRLTGLATLAGCARVPRRRWKAGPASSRGKDLRLNHDSWRTVTPGSAHSFAPEPWPDRKRPRTGRGDHAGAFTGMPHHYWGMRRDPSSVN